MNTLKPVNLRPVVRGSGTSWHDYLRPSCPYETADVGPTTVTHRTVCTTSFSGSQRKWGGDAPGEGQANDLGRSTQGSY
jgi:hypothetical protein